MSAQTETVNGHGHGRVPELCRFDHFVGMAYAVGRFTRVVGYIAASGGPVRPTREQAIADECAATHTTPAVRRAERDLCDRLAPSDEPADLLELLEAMP